MKECDCKKTDTKWLPIKNGGHWCGKCDTVWVEIHEHTEAHRKYIDSMREGIRENDEAVKGLIGAYK